MTVSAANYTPDTYAGNGVTVAFAVTFTFSVETDLVVTERTIATGAEVVKTLTTDYTVSGGSGSTGTVTAVTAPASTVQWIIARNTTATQAADFSDNDPFPAETLEGALDKLTRIVQEAEYDASRSLRFPTTDSTSLSAILPNSVTRAGKLLRFTPSTGEPEAAAAADIDLTTVTAYIATLLDDPDAATARTTLGLGTAALEDVAAGGSGDLLRADGDGSSLTGITAGALVLVSSATASNDAAIVFTGLSATYNSYEIIFNNLKPVTDAVHCLMEFSTDNGLSWQTSNYERVGWYMYEGGTLSGWDGSAEVAMYFGVVGNETNESIAGHFMLHNPAAAQWTMASSTSLWVNSVAGAIFTASYQYVWKDTSAVNAIRLRFSSGNISSGEARLYGRKAA